MPNYLFIQSSPYDVAIGAQAIDYPSGVSAIVLPNIALAEDQGQVIIGEEAHIHVTAGGVLNVSDGDRLIVDATAVGALGVVEAQVNAVVVDSQVMPVTPEDPNRALAEALIAAGLATLDENGNLVAITDAASEQVAPQEQPPPTTASDDAGIPITSTPIDSTPPTVDNQQTGGCDTWTDVYADPVSGEILTAIYHSTSATTYEVFA